MKQRIKFYVVKDEYIRYLRNDEKLKKVVLSSHEGESREQRPYIGISLKLNNNNYFLPLSSPKLNKDYFKDENNNYSYRKNTRTIMRFFDESSNHNKMICKILINNMIPVPLSELLPLNSYSLTEKYKILLRKEYLSISKYTTSILTNSRYVYNCKVHENDPLYFKNNIRPGFLKATVDFKYAEKLCLKWIVEHNKNKKSTTKTLVVVK